MLRQVPLARSGEDLQKLGPTPGEPALASGGQGLTAFLRITKVAIVIGTYVAGRGHDNWQSRSLAMLGVQLSHGHGRV